MLPVNHVANGQGFASTVRVARRSSTGRGYSVGSVVTRYAEASDTNAEWVYRRSGFSALYRVTARSSPPTTR